MYTKLSSILLFTLLLISLPVAVHAQQEEDEGKLQIQINRIGEDEKGSSSVETELDKRFPDLFDPTTEENIREQQHRAKAEMEKFERELFQENEQLDNGEEDITEQLFSSDYTAPSKPAAEETASEGPFGIILIIALGLFGAALIAGLIWTFRKIA